MRLQKHSAAPSSRQNKCDPIQVHLTAEFDYDILTKLVSVAEFYDLITAVTAFAVQKLPGQLPDNELFRDHFGFWFDMTKSAVKINDQQKYLLFVLQSGITVDRFVAE